MLKRSLAFIALLLASRTEHAVAQVTGVPLHAFAFGWSPAAGLIGVELVARSFEQAPRLGGAVGVGIGGVGARLDLTLREPRTHNRVPYLAAGYVITPWIPSVKLSSAATFEGGVQIWPVRPRRLYLDVGTGIAFLSGASDKLGPVLRLLVGATF